MVCASFLIRHPAADLHFVELLSGLNQLESIRADPNLGFSLRTAASAKIEATEGVVVAAEEDSNDTVKCALICVFLICYLCSSHVCFVRNSLVFDLDAVLLTQRSDVSTDCKLEQPLPWPAPIALTTRFKRLIDHIVRQIPTDASGSTRPPPLLQALLEQDRADSSAWALDESPFVFSENGLGKGASKQHAGTAEPDQAERSGWTKRERIAFLKVVAAFGQLKSSDGERVRSTFLHCRSRSDSDLVDMCGPLFETCLKYIASTPTKARVHALPWSQPVDAKPDEHMVDVAPETIVDVAAEPVEAASEPALTSVCPFTSLMAGPTALKLTERVQLLNCLEALFALPASAEHSEAALRAQDKIRQTCYSADVFLLIYITVSHPFRSSFALCTVARVVVRFVVVGLCVAASRCVARSLCRSVWYRSVGISMAVAIASAVRTTAAARARSARRARHCATTSRSVRCVVERAEHRRGPTGTAARFGSTSLSGVRVPTVHVCAILSPRRSRIHRRRCRGRAADNARRQAIATTSRCRHGVVALDRSGRACR
jgi:hypothetical protein